MFVELLAVTVAGATPQAQPDPVDKEIDSFGGQVILPQMWANECEPWDEWNKDARPFIIAPGVWYIGSCGITALLVTTPDGHVLFDTGTEDGVEVVLRNLSRIGIEPERIGLILSSHEHFDHIGGLAHMQRKTGAPVVASPIAAETMISGEAHPSDPQAGMHEAMEPAPSVISVEPGSSFVFGGIEFHSISTPGHTPGALSWQWQTCNEGICRTFVYADSLSPVSREGYRFSDHPDYLAEYRAGIARLRNLNCDILLTPHPSHSMMVKRAATGTFEGGMTCREYAVSKTKALDERLAKEATQ